MSEALATEVVKKLRKDAQFIDQMCFTYPGDPTGEIGADVYIIEQIAELIEEVNWDIVRAHYLANRPKVIFTYGDVNEDPTSQ